MDSKKKRAAPATRENANTSNTYDCITVLESTESVAFRYKIAGLSLEKRSAAENHIDYSHREIPVSSLADIKKAFAELHENPFAIAVLGRIPNGLSGSFKLQAYQIEDRLSRIAIFEVGLGIPCLSRFLPVTVTVTVE